jgi:hypothetical protein
MQVSAATKTFDVRYSRQNVSLFSSSDTTFDTEQKSMIITQFVVIREYANTLNLPVVGSSFE